MTMKRVTVVRTSEKKTLMASMATSGRLCQRHINILNFYFADYNHMQFNKYYTISTYYFSISQNSQSDAAWPFPSYLRNFRKHLKG